MDLTLALIRGGRLCVLEIDESKDHTRRYNYRCWAFGWLYTVTVVVSMTDISFKRPRYEFFSLQWDKQNNAVMLYEQIMVMLLPGKPKDFNSVSQWGNAPEHDWHEDQLKP